jgi:hypothetical protein
VKSKSIAAPLPEFVEPMKAKLVDSSPGLVPHKRNPKMIYTHYRDLVTPEDAQAFWQIYPTGN